MLTDPFWNAFFFFKETPVKIKPAPQVWQRGSHFLDFNSTEENLVDRGGKTGADVATPPLIDETDSWLQMWHEDDQKPTPGVSCAITVNYIKAVIWKITLQSRRDPRPRTVNGVIYKCHDCNESW